MQVNAHWDSLQACVVGSAYPPEFYSFVEHPGVRNNLETIAQQTCEDLDGLQQLLESFGVSVTRPSVAKCVDTVKYGNKILPAPLTPRDHFGVIDTTLFMPTPDVLGKWRQLRGADWPDVPPADIVEYDGYTVESLYDYDHTWMTELPKDYEHIVYDQDVDTAMVQRLGDTLLCGNWQDDRHRCDYLQQQFPDKTVSLVNSQGHLDGVVCHVTPELVFVSSDMAQYFAHKHIEVHVLTNTLDRQFQREKQHMGKWWLPDCDTRFADYVDSYLKHWLGDIQESYFDVNMLIVDPSTVVVSSYDDAVFRVLEQHGITAHVAQFRHQLFWDSGIHCLTNDLDRQC
tara:strand:- start:721 stop:1746 length:1026 start_codon:yes stop_codon:yes gene_type:complete